MLLFYYLIWITHFRWIHLEYGNENGRLYWLRVILANRIVRGLKMLFFSWYKLLGLCGMLIFLWTYVISLYLYPCDTGRFDYFGRTSFVAFVLEEAEASIIWNSNYGAERNSRSRSKDCFMLSFPRTDVKSISQCQRDAGRSYFGRTIFGHLFLGSKRGSIGLTVLPHWMKSTRSRSLRFHRPRIKLTF